MRLLRVVLLIWLIAPLPVQAQFTWSGAGGSPNWSVGSNWVGGIAPPSAATTTLTFTGSAGLSNTNNLASPFALNALTFNASAGAFSLSGGVLNLAANGSTQPTLVQNSNNTQLIANTLIISGTSLTVGGSGFGDVAQLGPVSGSGGLNIDFASFITQMYLANLNTYSGGTTVNNGTLLLAAVNAIPRLGTLTVNDILVLNPSGTLPSGVLAGSYDQRVNALAGGSIGVIQLGNAYLTVGYGNSNTTYAGAITTGTGETGGLVKVGTGTLTLNNDSNFLGTAIINRGTVTLSGANGALSSAGLSIGNSASLTIDNSTTNANRLGNAAPVTLRGGTVQFNNGGTLTEQVGSLSAAIGANTIDVNASGTTLSFTTYSPSDAGTVRVLVGTGKGTVNFRTTVPAMTNGIVPSMFASGTTNDFVKVVAGNLAPLAGADYVTTFSTGTATSNINTTEASITIASASTRNSLILSAAAAQTVTNNGGLTLTAGAIMASGTGGKSISGTGTLNLATVGFLYVPSAVQTLTISSPISATHLTFTGPGTLAVTGSASISNSLNVNSGTVNFPSSAFVTVPNHRIMAGASLVIPSGSVNLGTGQTLSGAGSFSASGGLSLSNGSVVDPNLFPGPATLSVTAPVTFSPGGTFRVRLNSVGGTTTDISRLSITGNLNLSTLNASNRYNIELVSLRADNSAGVVSDFNNMTSYSWTIVDTTTGITGFAPDKFNIQIGAFANSLGGGAFSIAQVGNTLVLNFTPVPEPGLILLLGIGGLWAGCRRRAK